MKRLTRTHRIGITGAMLLLPVLAVAGFQAPYDFEHGPVAYTTSAPSDAIARLQSKIDSG